MSKITIKGSGQLNGPVNINKTIEIPQEQVKNFIGSKKDDAIQALLLVHYPGVKVDVKKIALNIIP